jgi:hypothetical protein
MKKIREMYEKLSRDEEIVFQVKTKKAFDEIIEKMRWVFDDWAFTWVQDSLGYKNTYFILGMWRDGMFQLRTSREDDHNHQIHIVADYKERPYEEIKHLRQIDKLIDIMDEHRTDFVKKRLHMDRNFDLVKKENKND